MISPVSTSSLARPKPTSLTSREQPPTPGIRPRLFSGSPKRAERAATLRSHAMASSRPPHTQGDRVVLLGTVVSDGGDGVLDVVAEGRDRHERSPVARRSTLRKIIST